MGHRFIGSHPDELDGGQPVEPGQFISELDPEKPKNKQLIDDGLIIEADIPRELPDGHPETLNPPEQAVGGDASDTGADLDNDDDEESSD